MKNIFIFVIITLIFLFPGCKPNQGESSTPDTPTISPDHLFTDEELMTTEDPNAAAVDETWAAWIKENYTPIRSLTASVYSDLQFLKSLLEGRRIVQLGESGHGVKEFNQAKVRLIRFLHQEMGFDVIAFESSIFDCFYTNESSGNMNAQAMMQNSIYAVWSTREVVKLFEYIKETQESERPLILAGFDMKRSGRAYDDRPEFFRDVIESIDSNYAQMVNDFDREFIDETKGISWDEIKSYITSRKDELMDFYESLVEFFDLNMDDLQNSSSQNPQSPLVARQEAWSVLQFIQFNEEGIDSTRLTRIRDNAMAENLSFLANILYPGKKIVVWAHNFHIRHHGEGVTNYSVRTMGTWTAEEFRPVLYTIGLYMYQGSAAWGDGDVYTISPPNANSLEAICYRARCKFLLVDMLSQVESEGNSWMFTTIEAKSWGNNPLYMVLRDQYDGILFIHTVNPPDYIDYM
jgi:erythromycin esterase